MDEHFERIYRDEAERYERLVTREDQRGRLFAALNELVPLSGLRVVETGAGTGRVTRILSVLVERIVAFDRSSQMLAEGQRVLEESGMENWVLGQAAHVALPLADDVADLAIEGWAFGHVTEEPAWPDVLRAQIAELERVTKPGGTIILIETLGTGVREAEPPSTSLARMYDLLESDHGFARQSIRTDYQFASVEEADELIRFFFGDAAADQWVAGKNIIVPEVTGIWHKRV